MFNSQNQNESPIFEEIYLMNKNLTAKNNVNLKLLLVIFRRKKSFVNIIFSKEKDLLIGSLRRNRKLKVHLSKNRLFRALHCY